MVDERVVHVSEFDPTPTSQGNMYDVWVKVYPTGRIRYELFILVDIFSEDAQTVGGDGHLVYTYKWVKFDRYIHKDVAEDA